MKVRLYGVRVQVADGLTCGDLFDFLENLEGLYGKKYRSRIRIIYVDSVKGVRVVLFLSVKDHRKFMTMKQNGLDFKVTPQEIEAGTQAVDFNILAIDEKTGRGLYQHYRDSLGIPTLTGLLAQLHDELVKAKRKEWIEVEMETDTNLTEGRATRQASKRFKGKLKIIETLDRASLAEFLSEIDALNSFTFELEALSDSQMPFRPFKPVVESARYTLKFSADMKPERWVQTFEDFIQRKNPISARVDGREGKTPRSFDYYEPMAKTYKTYNFDEAVAAIEPNTFDKHVFVVDMVDFIKSNPDIFSEGANDDEEDEE